MAERTHSSGHRRISFTIWMFSFRIDRMVINTIVYEPLRQNQSPFGSYINDLSYFYEE